MSCSHNILIKIITEAKTNKTMDLPAATQTQLIIQSISFHAYTFYEKFKIKLRNGILLKNSPAAFF